MTMNAPTYDGKTADEYRAMAADSRKRSADSFERSDTDGFASQWANDTMARELQVKAELAENNGMVEIDALFLADGTLASTHSAYGDYGQYWVLNDAATAAFGKRFYSPSQAAKSATRNRNNAKKGFTVGTIRVAGFVTLAGSGTGMAGALSVRPVTRPNVDALKAGRFEILGTDTDTTDY